MRAAKILEITSYPPPRAGWGVRVWYLKRQLEAEGHHCVVLNIGTSRKIPSDEYETVLGGLDYLTKVIRYVRAGFTPHIHVNGASHKGLVLSFIAEAVSLLFGRRPFLTFHAGIEQVIFPRTKAPAWAPIFWLLFAAPRAIICNSDAVKEKIVEYGVRPRKVVPIPAFSRQYLEDDDAPLPKALEAFYQQWPQVIFCYIRLRPLFYPVELIQGFVRFALQHPGVGLVLCGAAGHMEGDLWPRTQAEIERSGISERILVLEDLEHGVFLAALRRSRLYLRSHVSDGVCSSVLEALSYRVPVVASENHTRPAGVICYPAADPDALAAQLAHVMTHHAAIVAALQPPPALDTLRTEIDLLVTP